MVLSDHEIRHLALFENMITPFSERVDGNGIISYGVTSYGYDVRVSTEFLVFNNLKSAEVDPKNFSPECFHRVICDDDHPYCLIPPNSFALSRTVETLLIPRNILAVVLGKSTYARSGIAMNATPCEPIWRGTITIELSNTTPCPARIYANEGIAQVVFHKASKECEVDYADKKGKYQNQVHVTPPIVE